MEELALLGGRRLDDVYVGVPHGLQLRDSLDAGFAVGGSGSLEFSIFDEHIASDNSSIGFGGRRLGGGI